MSISNAHARNAHARNHYMRLSQAQRDLGSQEMQYLEPGIKWGANVAENAAGKLLSKLRHLLHWMLISHEHPACLSRSFGGQLESVNFGSYDISVYNYYVVI